MPAASFRAQRRPPSRLLTWGLAGAAAVALGVVAVTAWRAAERQRKDGEAALRESATKTAAGLAIQLDQLFAKENRTGVSDAIVAKTDWFTTTGQPDDWVFGPWPQPASELEKWLQQFRRLRLEGKTSQAVKLIDTASNPLGNWLTLYRRDGNENWTGGLVPDVVRWDQPSHQLAGTTSSGLPLGPMVLRELMLLEAYPEDSAFPAASSYSAAKTWQAAVAMPCALTSRLVEESGKVFETILLDVDTPRFGDFPPSTKTRQLAALKESLAAARRRAAELDGLREVLTKDRGRILNRAPWLDGTWHCSYPGDGTIKFRPLGDLQKFAQEKGTLTGGLLLPSEWRAQITLNGVKLTGDIAPPDRILGTATQGPWKVAVSTVSLTPFAELQSQLIRQRWLISGAASALTTALGGFLWVLARQRRLTAMMSNFVASVSHELRAPIGSIGLLAERLGTGRVEDAAEQSHYHNLIRGECRRLSGTIENVLSFSRLERGQTARELELSDLTALVRETTQLLAPLAQERGVTLLTTLPETPLEIEIDPGAIRQAVLNLLDNALKFSPPRSIIRLSLTENASEAVITVSDTGPGIPEEEHVRIFDPFYRIGNELRRETPGIGIGLAIVRQAALAHGGSVSVRNKKSRTGSGAIFELRLKKIVEAPPLET